MNQKQMSYNEKIYLEQTYQDGNMIVTVYDEPDLRTGMVNLAAMGYVVATPLTNGAVAYDITDAGLAAIGKGKSTDDSHVETQKAEWVVLGGIVQKKAQKQTDATSKILEDADQGIIIQENNPNYDLAMQLVAQGLLSAQDNPPGPLDDPTTTKETVFTITSAGRQYLNGAGKQAKETKSGDFAADIPDPYNLGQMYGLKYPAADLQSLYQRAQHDYMPLRDLFLHDPGTTGIWSAQFEAGIDAGKQMAQSMSDAERANPAGWYKRAKSTNKNRSEKMLAPDEADILRRMSMSGTDEITVSQGSAQDQVCMTLVREGYLEPDMDNEDRTDGYLSYFLTDDGRTAISDHGLDFGKSTKENEVKTTKATLPFAARDMLRTIQNTSLSTTNYRSIWSPQDVHWPLIVELANAGYVEIEDMGDEPPHFSVALTTYGEDEVNDLRYGKSTRDPQPTTMVLGGIVQNVPPVKKAQKDATSDMIDFIIEVWSGDGTTLLWNDIDPQQAALIQSGAAQGFFRLLKTYPDGSTVWGLTQKGSDFAHSLGET